MSFPFSDIAPDLWDQLGEMLYVIPYVGSQILGILNKYSIWEEKGSKRWHGVRGNQNEALSDALVSSAFPQ